MKIEDVVRNAFAMPLTSPSYPPGPYRFVNREYMIITYRTDPEALRRVVPEPLQFDEPLVKYEFIRMPDSTGFGDYTESGQVIPVTYEGVHGGYVHSMYLNDDAPIAGGREIWGFPKKLAEPSLTPVKDALVGTLDYGGSAGGDRDDGFQASHAGHGQNPRKPETAEFHAEDHSARGLHAAYLRARPLLSRGSDGEGRVGRAGCLGIVSAMRWRRSPTCRCWRSNPPSIFSSDLTLGLGEVVHDYLAK